jgi:UDP-glucose 4-epimerase
MKRILVTGGAGFIGSHLCERLLNDGNDVICLDNYFTGSKDNICHLIGNDHFELVRHDITQPYTAEVDEIYNLACPASPVHYQHDPVKTILTCVIGSMNMLGLAKRVGAKILQASTSEVYGKSDHEAFAETDDLLIGTPYHSRWGYACSKLLDEFYLMAYHREYALPGTVVRFFNTVGPGQSGRYGMVIPRMTELALAGKDVAVYGDGTQSRCFCHVRDTVRAVLALFDNDESIGRIYNIGSVELVTIKDLAERIIQRTGSSSKIVYIPYEKAYQPGFEDMHRRKPDTSAINALTGWRPEACLDQIIDDVAAYLRAKESF